MSVPNQKTITVRKLPCNKENKYCVQNLEGKRKAAQELEAGAFKLWNYFSDNQDNYTFDLSRVAVENNYGIKKRQYDGAIAELIEKGYLVLTDKKNNYTFVEDPDILKKSKPQIQDVIIEKPQIQKDTTTQIQNVITPDNKIASRPNNKTKREILQYNTLNNTNNNTFPIYLIKKEDLDKIPGEKVNMREGVVYSVFTQRAYKVEE